jgi:UDP-GlcNAc:undecaprenyl-phosphate GlcNAc-1-phosphate transferase
MIFQFFMAFAVPVVITLLVTPWLIRFAARVGAMDQPSPRKIHTHPIPRLGGVAIYVSFFLSLGFLNLIDPGVHELTSLAPTKGVMLTVGLVLILGLGIFDDLRPRTPTQKLIVQLIAGTSVYFAGYGLSSIHDPLSGRLLDLGILGYPATLLWIVGITNAFNLIDGLDGLAAGVAAIACFGIWGISLLTGDISTAVLVLILAGSVVGFLRYNFVPARIFLGDSGSLFLGFALAVFSLKSSTKGSTALAVVVPILALGLPIMDTLLSMVRRLLRSLLPEQAKSKSLIRKLGSVFLPDTQHIHHQLMARGLSHRNVVLLLYLASCVFAIGAFSVTIADNVSASIILLAVTVAIFIGVRQLRYKEMAVLKNGVFLPFYEWPLMNRSLFQAVLNLAFVLLAYGAAYRLVYGGNLPLLLQQQLSVTLLGVCAIKLTVFYFTGLYKGAFRHLAIGDLLKILKAVAISVAISTIVLALLPKPWSVFNLSVSVLDFYILLSLILASRISFQVLNYLFRHEHPDDKQVIIYGANANGIWALHRILAERTLKLNPVGFLDDSPLLEGKRLYGYPIFGGHWKLQRLLKKMKIDEVLLSGDGMKPETLNRLKQLARAQGLALRRFEVYLEKVPLEKEGSPTSQPPAVVVSEGEREPESIRP